MHEDFVEHANDEVEPLVLHEPCDHCDHRRTAVFRQTKVALETHLVVALALDSIFHAVVDVEARIRLRVVDAVVDAVDDAGQIRTAAAQQPVQMFAVVFVLDLLGIGLADG